jgi:hypothetical protein
MTQLPVYLEIQYFDFVNVWALQRKSDTSVSGLAMKILYELTLVILTGTSGFSIFTD